MNTFINKKNDKYYETWLIKTPHILSTRIKVGKFFFSNLMSFPFQKNRTQINIKNNKYFLFIN